MRQKGFSRFMALFLSVLLVFSGPGSVWAANPDSFADLPQDWSTPAVRMAVEHDYLSTENGRVDAKGNVSQADLAATLVRILGPTAVGDVSGYDLDSGAAYYQDLAKAISMGAFAKFPQVQPLSQATRQEVFAAFANLFALEGTSVTALFTDGDQVASWAQPGAAGMVNARYVQGYNGYLRPGDAISRAELAQVIYNMIQVVLNTAGPHTSLAQGNVLLTVGSSSLQNTTVYGDLILADSIGEATVTLDNVTVTGRIIIRGGQLVVNGGQIGGIVVAKKSNLSLTGASVDRISILPGADGSTIDAGADSSVGSIDVAGNNTEISGAGTVNSVNVEGNNTTIDTNETEVHVAENATGTKVKDQAVAGGSDVKSHEDGTVTEITIEEDETPTSGGTTTTGGGSSSSSGGGTSYLYVDMKESLDVNGVTYYYAENANHTSRTRYRVNGTVVSATAVNVAGTVYKYTESAVIPEAVVYGTVGMSYAEYYYGELAQPAITGSLVEEAGAEPWLAYDVAGKYDAVTSATSANGSHSSDYPAILDYQAGGADLTLEPMTISGINTVDVAVPYELYVNALILNALGRESAAGNAVAALSVTDTAPAAAKMLLADGSYAAQAAAAGAANTEVAAGGLTGAVSYSSSYGQYGFKLTLGHFTDNSTQREAFVDYLDNLYSVVVEDSAGNRYGAVHYEDIWDEASHFGYIDLVISEGEVTARNHTYLNNRFSGMFADGIIIPGEYKITIKSRGYADAGTTVVIGQKLFVGVSIADVVWNTAGDTLVTVDAGELPADYGYESVSVSKGSGRNAVVLTAGEDYVWDSTAKTLTIQDTANTGTGAYTLTLTDSNGKYSSVSAGFNLTESDLALSVSLAGDAETGYTLIVDDPSVTVATYLAALTNVNVKEADYAQAGVDYAASGQTAVVLFGADGQLNLAAQDGNGEPVFTSGKEYLLTLTATAYLDVVLTLDLTGEEPGPEPGGLQDGSYFAQALVSGYNGNDGNYYVGVTITIEGGELTSVVNSSDDVDDWVYENWSYITTAFNGSRRAVLQPVGVIEQLVTNKVAIEEVDAVTGATYTSDSLVVAILDALIQAGYETGGGTTLAAPRLAPADGRSEDIYAAEEGAVLQVESTDAEAAVYYSTDGSSPLPSQNPEAQVVDLDSGEIVISPDDLPQNANSQLETRVVAVKNGNNSSVTSKTLTFVVPDQAPGTKRFAATAYCTYGYDVDIWVTAVNGVITKIEDNNTYPGAANQVYWNGAWEALAAQDGNSQSLIGKTLPQVAEMQTAPNAAAEYKVDAVSGATYSSDALKNAVLHALLNEPYFESASHTVAEPWLTTAEGFWLFPNSAASAVVEVTLPAGAQAYYTTDGSEPTSSSQLVTDGQIVLANESAANPSGKIVDLRLVAVSGGESSLVVRQPVVFAEQVADGAYANGAYFRDYNPSEDLDVEVIIRAGYISALRVVPYGQVSAADLAACRLELLPQVLLHQSTDLPLLAGREEASRLILDAIQFHLDAAFTDTREQAALPVMTLSLEKSTYDNADMVEVSLVTDTPEAQIYYTVDYSYSVGNTLSDPCDETATSPRYLYEGPFTVNINQAAGGTVYVRAVAVSEAAQYSEIVRRDLYFTAAVAAGSIVVDGTPYATFAEAVAQINASPEGGVIVLRDDLELSSADLSGGMPGKPCQIIGEGNVTLKGTATPLIAQADLSFESLTLNINTFYANGYDLTIGEDVTTAFSFFGPTIYGGGPYAASGANEVNGSPVLTVQSGKFDVYASGAGGTTLNGAPEVYIGGSANVKLIGAAMNATIDGDLLLWLEGDGVTLTGLTGEQNLGVIKGELVVLIYDTPLLDTYYTYTASVNRSSFGCLYLFDSLLDTAIFKNFAEVEAFSGLAAAEALELEEEAAAEEEPADALAEILEEEAAGQPEQEQTEPAGEELEQVSSGR